MISQLQSNIVILIIGSWIDATILYTLNPHHASARFITTYYPYNQVNKEVVFGGPTFYPKFANPSYATTSTYPANLYFEIGQNENIQNFQFSDGVRDGIDLLINFLGMCSGKNIDDCQNSIGQII